MGIISDWRRCWKKSTIVSSIILAALAVATAAGFLLAIAAAATFPVVGQPIAHVSGIVNFCIGAGLGALSTLGLIGARIISDDFYDVVYDSFTSRNPDGRVDWLKTSFSFLLTIILVSVMPLLVIAVISAYPLENGGYLHVAASSFSALISWLRDNAGGPVGFFQKMRKKRQHGQCEIVCAIVNGMANRRG